MRAVRSVIEGTDAAVDRGALREVQLADDRLDVQADHVVGQDLGYEGEDGSELLELDGDHGGAARDRAALRDRVREQAADQEPGGLAIQGHQVGLGQDLGQGVGPQGVDEQREMPGVEDAEQRGGPGGRDRVVLPAVPLNGPANPRGPMPWLMVEVEVVVKAALSPTVEPRIDLPRE